MDRWLRIGLSTLVTGTAASVVSTAALALLAQGQGKSAFQPTNATSHWLHGDRAASHGEPDAAHTLIGYATHHTSALFWAVPFEAWLAAGRPEPLARCCETRARCRRARHPPLARTRGILSAAVPRRGCFRPFGLAKLVRQIGRGVRSFIDPHRATSNRRAQIRFT